MGVIATVIGGVVSAVGAIQSANAQASAANYNAQINQRNAVIAEQNRQQDITTAQIATDDKRRDNARTLATIRSAYGSSGLDLAGSPLDVLTDSASELELDAQRTGYEGRVKAREGALNVLGYKEQATLNKMQASSAKTAGYLSAFGTLAKTAGSVMSPTGQGLTN